MTSVQNNKAKIITLLTTTDLSTRQIAAKVGVHHQSVARICCNELGQQFYNDRVSRLSNLNRSQHISGGYLTVPTPFWWVGVSGTRVRHCVAKHQLVFCEANGLTKLPDGYVVHHINEDKLDNRVENLQLMTTSEHMKHHSLRRHGNDK